jgi:ABC-type nitrate/sulfonate/bicarbonate transport system permease component
MKNIGKAPSWKVLIAQAAAVGAVLAVMQFVVDKGIVSSLFLASPLQIITEFIGLLKEDILFDNLVITLLEFFLGFILSIAAGVGLGIIIATVPTVERFFKPFISLTMAIPKVTLIPLLTIWFGIGINSKVLMVFIFAVFSILHNTIAGVKQTSENYLKVARVFEASRLQVVTKVLLPSSMPMIFAGFRVAAANGLVGALFAEMMASKAGLGNLLTKASQLYLTGQLFSIIIIVTLISVIIIQIIDILEKKYFLKWFVN